MKNSGVAHKTGSNIVGKVADLVLSARHTGRQSAHTHTPEGSLLGNCSTPRDAGVLLIPSGYTPAVPTQPVWRPCSNHTLVRYGNCTLIILFFGWWGYSLF
jgi:hypothetical protein